VAPRAGVRRHRYIACHGLAPPNLTVVYLDRLRAQVQGKLIVKGIVTGEDAALAVKHGADGVVVSNHGGRNEETLRAPVDCLAEIVAAVRGRVPVFVDGGYAAAPISSRHWRWAPPR